MKITCKQCNGSGFHEGTICNRCQGAKAECDVCGRTFSLASPDNCCPHPVPEIITFSLSLGGQS
jgi:hypothetical protein